jgi:hypothetical protein
MSSIYDTAAAKLATAKTEQEAEAICAEFEAAGRVKVAEVESQLATERAFRDRLLKTRALREALVGKVAPKMLPAAALLLLDTFDLQVTDDQRVIVKNEFGGQPVDSVVAGWLAASGRAFAESSSSANARPGPFEAMLSKVLH